jgi:hypothetical protein
MTIKNIITFLAIAPAIATHTRHIEGSVSNAYTLEAPVPLLLLVGNGLRAPREQKWDHGICVERK